MSPEDRARRRSAKRVNERIKLMAAFCNTLGVAFLITLVVAPFASGGQPPLRQVLLGIILAATLHAIGQTFLQLWRSED